MITVVAGVGQTHRLVGLLSRVAASTLHRKHTTGSRLDATPRGARILPPDSSLPTRDSCLLRRIRGSVTLGAAGTARILPIAWRVVSGAWRVIRQVGGSSPSLPILADGVRLQGAMLASFEHFPQVFTASLASFDALSALRAPPTWLRFARSSPLLTRAIACHSGRWVRFVSLRCASRALRTAAIDPRRHTRSCLALWRTACATTEGGGFIDTTKQ